jgi:hypothetical protein
VVTDEKWLHRKEHVGLFSLKNKNGYFHSNIFICGPCNYGLSLVAFSTGLIILFNSFLSSVFVGTGTMMAFGFNRL